MTWPGFTSFPPIATVSIRVVNLHSEAVYETFYGIPVRTPDGLFADSPAYPLAPPLVPPRLPKYLRVLSDIGNLHPRVSVADLEPKLIKYGTITNLWVAKNPPGLALPPCFPVMIL